MARDAPELIACPACGSLNEDATALLDQAREDIKALERDLRGKRSRISRLEAERHQTLRDDKRYALAMEVLQHWQNVCAPNAREIDSAERLAAVLARLKGGHSVDELKLCADGYGRFPYVTDKGRMPTGEKHQWHADAELIYRTPKNVTSGIALASRPLPGHHSLISGETGPIERLDWRIVRRANREYILKALRETYRTKGVEDESFGGSYTYWLFPCPRCLLRGDDDWSLKVYPEDSNRIVECWRCGIDEGRLLAAITQENH